MTFHSSVPPPDGVPEVGWTPPCSLCNKPTVGTAFTFEGGHYLHDSCRGALAEHCELQARESIATAIKNYESDLVAADALESIDEGKRLGRKLAALKLALLALDLAATA